MKASIVHSGHLPERYEELEPCFCISVSPVRGSKGAIEDKNVQYCIVKFLMFEVKYL